MEAVLYVGHGSRVKAGAEEALAFIENAKSGVHCEIQESCFMELAEPDIPTGIQRCIERGATKVNVVPVLLLTAVHAKLDIPEAIDEARLDYPQVEFNYGRPFGVHSKITESLLDRVFEQVEKPDKDAMVLLIGRGSSDLDVKRDLTEIAERLATLYPFQKVDVCFMYGAKPGFHEGLKLAEASGHRQVFVIPYLLFTGILMEEIATELGAISTENQEFVLCESLGYDPNIIEVLRERANELLTSTIEV